MLPTCMHARGGRNLQLPPEMSLADAVESSRFHLLKAVELGCRGGVDALVEEVEGSRALGGAAAMCCMALGVLVLVAVVALVVTVLLR